MKTISITIDDGTLKLLDELNARQPARPWSALVRAALREFAERERRRVTEEHEREVFRKNRTQLSREARALVPPRPWHHTKARLDKRPVER